MIRADGAASEARRPPVPITLADGSS